MNSTIFLRILFALVTSLGFAILLNIERKKAFIAAFGGALSWTFYELSKLMFSTDATALFVGSFVMGIYSEFMARRFKSPATIFYIPGFVTLVPGSNVYFCVLAAVQGKTEEAISQFLFTLVFSAAITLGLILASAVVAVYKGIRLGRIKTFFKEVRRK